MKRIGSSIYIFRRFVRIFVVGATIRCRRKHTTKTVITKLKKKKKDVGAEGVTAAFLIVKL